MEKETGWTKESGWQFGIRRSVLLPLEEVWNFLFSKEGTALWSKGVVTGYTTHRHLSHIRTKWKKDDWPNIAALQMRVMANKDKTMIAFHIDKLLNKDQREETGKHWKEIMSELTQKLESRHNDN